MANPLTGSLSVHEKVRPGKRKPSLSHRKRILDAVNYEVGVTCGSTVVSVADMCLQVNAHRLSVSDQRNPDLVTVTPSGSA